jgi:DHA1 family bicyclomycin/chloramphenicol resistance-like MFS transporter
MNLRVLILAALITAFAPLSMDLYLPGLPDLRRDFGVSEPVAQLTVTGCIVGLAFGQFLVSLLPERIGRRPPLLVAMGLWILATVLCSLAPNIAAVVGIRVVQGVGAGMAFALARAVVADLDPRNLSTHISRMMLVLSVVPILAPALGGFAMSFTDWRGLFLGLAVTGGVAFVIVSRSLAESHQVPEAGYPQRSPFAPMAELLRSRSFLLPALISSTAFGVMFSYIGQSSFVLRDYFGLKALPYGLLFGMNAAALIAGFQIGPRLERVWGTKRVLQVAAVVGAAGAVCMTVSALLLPRSLAPVVVALALILAAAGTVNPVATAAAMDSHPDEIGATSGLVGALQFLIGGAISAVPGLLPFGPGAGGLGTVCLACLGGCLLGCLGLAPSKGQKRAPFTDPEPLEAGVKHGCVAMNKPECASDENAA